MTTITYTYAQQLTRVSIEGHLSNLEAKILVMNRVLNQECILMMTYVENNDNELYKINLKILT